MVAEYSPDCYLPYLSVCSRMLDDEVVPVRYRICAIAAQQSNPDQESIIKNSKKNKMMIKNIKIDKASTTFVCLAHIHTHRLRCS